jgi:hypothetical protein
LETTAEVEVHDSTFKSISISESCFYF